MFTGIIQELGIVNNILDSNINKFEIITDLDLSACSTGSSICCDGICLTVTKITFNNKKYIFEVIIGEETFNRTTVKLWKQNTILNIEKSLIVGDEISGHFVYGHVDTTIKISKIEKLNSSWNFYFSNSTLLNYKKFIVEKGSIAINGISLTVANVKRDLFDISIIPHTYNNTNLSHVSEGDLVNIEFDALARYILANNE